MPPLEKADDATQRLIDMVIFDRFFDKILKIEGGYSDNPQDSGGKTKYGVTESVARNYGYKGDMRNFSIEAAKEVYKRLYWSPLRLDDVAALDEDVALKLGDIAVNMGPVQAAKFFQRALNLFNRRGEKYPELVVDGMIGKASIAALKAFMGQRGAQGALVLYRVLNCMQGACYIALAEHRDKDEEFIYGWILNRVA